MCVDDEMKPKREVTVLPANGPFLGWVRNQEGETRVSLLLIVGGMCAVGSALDDQTCRWLAQELLKRVAARPHLTDDDFSNIAHEGRTA